MPYACGFYTIILSCRSMTLPVNNTGTRRRSRLKPENREHYTDVDSRIGRTCLLVAT